MQLLPWQRFQTEFRFLRDGQSIVWPRVNAAAMPALLDHSRPAESSATHSTRNGLSISAESASRINLASAGSSSMRSTTVVLSSIGLRRNCGSAAPETHHQDRSTLDRLVGFVRCVSFCGKNLNPSGTRFSHSTAGLSLSGHLVPAAFFDELTSLPRIRRFECF